MKKAKHTVISPNQSEILNGMLLGDASLIRQRSNWTPRMTLTTIRQEYAEHLLHILPFSMKLNVLPKRQTIENGKLVIRQETFTITTKADIAFFETYDLWYHDGHKTIPTNLELTPLTVTHWFYGDGSTTAQHKPGYTSSTIGLKFSTESFSYKDCLHLASMLKKNHIDLTVSPRNHDQFVLRTSKLESVLALYQFILPYCECRCFDYKMKLPTPTIRKSKTNKLLENFTPNLQSQVQFVHAGSVLDPAL
jgi:hypothetical protein